MSNPYFKKTQNGYDRVQVDKYIRKLKEAYEKSYKDYLDVYDKYRKLSEVSKNGGNILL